MGIFPSYPCPRCEGSGIDDKLGGTMPTCEPCEGSGIKEGRKPPIVSHLEGRLRSLQTNFDAEKYRADCAEERVRDKRKVSPQSSQDDTCVVCEGRGFSPRDDLWDNAISMGMDKCRTCDGMGKRGDPPTLIARLWHEVDRLSTTLNHKFYEWESRAPPSPREATVKAETDVWLHILGLDGTPSHSEIRKAYKDKATEFHPDTGGSDLGFRTVRMAYDNLMETHSD